jgi:hypothetical protein
LLIAATAVGLAAIITAFLSGASFVGTSDEAYLVAGALSRGPRGPRGPRPRLGPGCPRGQ